MPSLRRRAGEASLHSGVPVQGLGLLFDGLRETRREAGGFSDGERRGFFEREREGGGVPEGKRRGWRRPEYGRSGNEGRFGGGFFEGEERLRPGRGFGGCVRKI